MKMNSSGKVGCLVLVAASLIGMLSPQVLAKELCQSVAECQALRNAAELHLREVFDRAIPAFGSISRDKDGNIRNLSSNDALWTCEDRDDHLPSTREWAILAQSRGALGIRETQYPYLQSTDPKVLAEIEQMKATGYEPILTTLSHQSRYDALAVDFYYSSSGYVPPAANGEQWSFWSYAGMPSPTVYSADRAYVFDGSKGTLFMQFWSDRYGVRCVDGPPPGL
ncbi:MAG TPA: hypothetical protein VL588_02960 [Bdellovibrionota bacterium]|jgi:hypothetical protein|nr:hypothetical protein [Bdellovibrionota bacterium]